MATINDVTLIEIDSNSDSRGALCPIEFSSLPIKPKRIFYVYGVTDRKTRGKHSHYKTGQILICLRGECFVRCRDGYSSRDWTLNNPNVGLYIPRMIWDEQIYMSEDTILLVIADTKYKKSDYIEDWEEYLKIVKSGEK